MTAGLKKQLDQALAQERKKAREEAEKELSVVQGKLDEANANELQLRRQKTELEQRAKDMDLEVQRRLDEEKVLFENRIVSRVVEDHRAKDAEKDRRLADTLAQVEDLKRRMEQGSQQAQGETLEAELEEMLRAQFPLDIIDPVSPGVKGGDILHTIFSRNGTECGKILWEIKRTKSWSEAWIAKVKSDARSVKADVCVIATETMPKGTAQMVEYDGVWVASPAVVVSLVYAIRQGLMRAAKERHVQSGKKDKAILVYDYFTGVEFRGRVEAIIQSYAALSVDLDAERRAMEKIWAKREKQISTIMLSLAGMHGEIEAIAAGELPAVPVLELGGGK